MEQQIDYDPLRSKYQNYVNTAVGETLTKLTLIFTALLLIGGSLTAGSYRVHYSIKGSGRDVTVQTESSAEARRTVMEMFSGSVVTGVHRIKGR